MKLRNVLGRRIAMLYELGVKPNYVHKQLDGCAKRYRKPRSCKERDGNTGFYT